MYEYCLKIGMTEYNPYILYSILSLTESDMDTGITPRFYGK